MVGGFVLIAGGLLGAALGLPVALAGALALGERLAEGPVTRWFWADSRQQLPGLSLALMALLLALSTNIGVGAMVEGFRVTFTRWLDDRLIAEVYFEASDDDAGQRVEAWLAKRPDVEAICRCFEPRRKSRIGRWKSGRLKPTKPMLSIFRCWSIAPTFGRAWREATRRS